MRPKPGNGTSPSRRRHQQNMHHAAFRHSQAAQIARMAPRQMPPHFDPMIGTVAMPGAAIQPSIQADATATALQGGHAGINEFQMGGNTLDNPTQASNLQQPMAEADFLFNNQQSDNDRNGRQPRNIVSSAEETAEERERAGMKREIASMRQRIDDIGKETTEWLVSLQAVLRDLVDVISSPNQGDFSADQLPPGV